MSRSALASRPLAARPIAARTDVAIVGGGTAAVEVLLALRARAADDLRVTLVAPDAHYRYRPLAAYAGLVPDMAQTVALDQLVVEQGAGMVVDRLASVDPERHELTTAEGGRIGYRALVLATGAVPHAAVAGAVTLGDRGDEPAFARLVERVRAGRVRRLAVVVPAGVGWSLPAYECALLLAHEAPTSIEIVVITAEPSPLAAFGDAVGRAIAALLARRGVELRTGSQPDRFADGIVWMPDEGAFAADAVIALAQPRGPFLPGLPHDRRGFLPVDAAGRVLGVADVWAVGDGAAHDVKQGGLALQQAEVAAADLVRALAIDDPLPLPSRMETLRAAMLDGRGTLYLRAERDGDDARWRTITSREPLWWPPAKIAGGHLSDYLAEHEPQP
ncbi:NAD(P)/FAD-dependent oxidoreductase [Patulibacter defluvii]|uniref:NAD(P)/FAD-dependent oxidoreductase n=1 Tax=Patulibacter defluvii TaxID=3095358 RepID=UPI002A75320A|nr:FAD-dependent oxidoreductase [Patulibacter sp. DM4]